MRVTTQVAWGHILTRPNTQTKLCSKLAQQTRSLAPGDPAMPEGNGDLGVSFLGVPQNEGPKSRKETHPVQLCTGSFLLGRKERSSPTKYTRVFQGSLWNADRLFWGKTTDPLFSRGIESQVAIAFFSPCCWVSGAWKKKKTSQLAIRVDTPDKCGIGCRSASRMAQRSGGERIGLINVR